MIHNYWTLELFFVAFFLVLPSCYQLLIKFICAGTSKFLFPCHFTLILMLLSLETFNSVDWGALMVLDLPNYRALQSI